MGPLVCDRQVYTVSTAGDQHRVRLPQIYRHRLLADNPLGLTRRRRDHHLRMQLVPGAHIDEVEALTVQHLSVVGVTMLLRDPKELAELSKCLRV